MDFVSKKTLSCQPVYVQHNRLENVRSLKILGCFFSQDLKWNVDSLIKKASKRICLIISLKCAGSPSKVMLICYRVFIHSLLLYACSVWCNFPYYLRKRLGIVVESFSYFELWCWFTVAVHGRGSNVLEAVWKICLQSDHPLRFFNDRQLRTNTVLSRPRTKTKRFCNSFIKYCRGPNSHHLSLYIFRFLVLCFYDCFCDVITPTVRQIKIYSTIYLDLNLKLNHTGY